MNLSDYDDPMLKYKANDELLGNFEISGGRCYLPFVTQLSLHTLSSSILLAHLTSSPAANPIQVHQHN